MCTDVTLCEKVCLLLVVDPTLYSYCMCPLPIKKSAMK